MRAFKNMSIPVNLALRGLALALRFALSFYIVKFLGLEAAGIYGLTLGVISSAPAILGWGLNYFVSRDIIGTSQESAGVEIRNRLIVTTITLAAVTALCLVCVLVADYPVRLLFVLVVLIVWMETYACDVHAPLISLEMPVLANVLFFIRSSLWIPFIIAAGVIYPQTRTLEIMYTAWAVSYVLMALVFWRAVSGWPIAAIIRKPIRLDWLTQRLRSSWPIYISDLSNVGFVYIDRYLISFYLGLTLTGVYTFYWSLTNAVQTLLLTAVVQVSLPKLFKAHAQDEMGEWRDVMRMQFLKIAVLSVVFGAGMLFASEILFRVMGMSELGEHRSVFILLLLASITRSCGDLLSVGLTSLRKDRYFVFLNLFSVFMSVVMVTAMVPFFGLVGAGIAALTTAIAVAVVGAFSVIVHSRSKPR